KRQDDGALRSGEAARAAARDRSAPRKLGWRLGCEFHRQPRYRLARRTRRLWGRCAYARGAYPGRQPPAARQAVYWLADGAFLSSRWAELAETPGFCLT